MDDKGFLINDKVLIKYTGMEEDITIPEGITQIAEYAFGQCESAVSIHVPESVDLIGDYAFAGCKWLKTIDLPERLKMLGLSVFRDCDSLEEIRLPAGITEVTRSCFYDCISLKRIELPEGIETVAYKAFAGCCALEGIAFGEGLKEIGEYAFELCSRLSSVILPEGLVRIGRHAFAGSVKLKEPYIPDSVEEIGCSAFYRTEFEEKAEDGLLIVGDGILVACRHTGTELTLPDTVKKIGELALAYNEDLVTVVLPDSVTEICGRAFERCTALENVRLPEALGKIGERAFADCTALAHITIPESTEYIGAEAFVRTGLSDGGKTIIIDGCLIEYHGEEEDITLPDEVRLVAGKAFLGNNEIKSIELNNAEIICDEAFRWCREFGRVHITEKVRYIGSYAFWGCNKLTARIDPARRLIGEFAFSEGQQLSFTGVGRDGFTAGLLNGLTKNSPEHALFGFSAEPSESRFMQLHYGEYMIPAALCMIDKGGIYESFLRENIGAAVCFAVDMRDSEMLGKLLRFGFQNERQAAECAAYAIEQNALEQQIMIMRCKQDSFGRTDEARIDNRFDW